MLQIYYKTIRDEKFIPLSEPKEGCWIHVDEATMDDILEISRLTGIDPVDLQDCLDKYEIPRIEKIHQNVLIFTRHPTDQEAGLYSLTLTFIITSHYFITISPQKSHLIDNFATLKTKFSTLQKSKLMINLLLRINQEFTTQIKKIRFNVLNQEKEINLVGSEDIAELTKSEEILNQYTSCLIATRKVLEAITSGRYTNLYEKDQELLQDLLNATKQSEDLCEMAVKSIGSLRDSYQIIFTNNLHKTIKLLTGLTIIFSIPTIIASLYGMNVALPLEKSTSAFMIILGVIVAICIAGVIFFHKRRWL